MPFTCGSHRAFVYERGGVVPVGELTPLSKARWRRMRDDISDAFVEVPTHECCELLGDLRTINHELHLERNGEVVWQGPITRLEYDWNTVGVYASDVLWYSTRTVIRTAYDLSYPAVGNVLDQMDWLLRVQVYNRLGDPWNVVPHLHLIRNPDPATEPKTHRVVKRYQYYAWEDFDKYAEDYGADYTVVNRDIYYWDTHFAWKVIPPLDDTYMAQFPRIVEYGNQLATRGYVTNGEGYAGIFTGDVSEYGYVDLLITNQNDGQQDGVPTTEEIAGWADTARRNIDGMVPPPVSVVIPANTTLLPGSPWTMHDLVPGAWFEVHVERMCREVSEWQRIHEVTVTEEGPTGEQVSFTATAAPASMIVAP